MCRARTSASSRVCSASAAFTRTARSDALARSAFFSSPAALAISRPIDFCSARAVSKATIAARRDSSAERNRSTNDGSSPRAVCDARTASGFSRSRRTSITPTSYRPGSDRPMHFLNARRTTDPVIGS